jgi:hypothetical protein
VPWISAILVYGVAVLVVLVYGVSSFDFVGILQVCFPDNRLILTQHRTSAFDAFCPFRRLSGKR